jgi:hypothetical protein
MAAVSFGEPMSSCAASSKENHEGHADAWAGSHGRGSGSVMPVVPVPVIAACCMASEHSAGQEDAAARHSGPLRKLALGRRRTVRMSTCRDAILTYTVDFGVEGTSELRQA